MWYAHRCHAKMCWPMLPISAMGCSESKRSSRSDRGEEGTSDKLTHSPPHPSPVQGCNIGNESIVRPATQSNGAHKGADMYNGNGNSYGSGPYRRSSGIP